MIPLAWLQTGGLTEIQRAVRSTFNTGGSLLMAFIVIATLIAIIYVAYWLTYHVPSSRPTGGQADASRLFHNVLRQLPLTRTQQRVLRRMAKDMHLPNPAAILLSTALYDRNTERWVDRRRPARQEAAKERLASARVVLFGQSGAVIP